MKLENFEVISPAGAGFGVGAVLRLSAAQAASRARSLEPLDQKDCYRVTGPVVFKCGETVGAYPAGAPRAFFVGLAAPGVAKTPRRVAKTPPAKKDADAPDIEPGGDSADGPAVSPDPFLA